MSGATRWSAPRIAQVLISRPSASARSTSPGRDVRRRTRTPSSAADATCAWTPPSRRTTSATGSRPIGSSSCRSSRHAEGGRPTDRGGHDFSVSWPRVQPTREDGSMGRITAFENVTLDGVMQAPAYKDEDRRGGFEHGGWAMPYADEEAGRAAASGMADTGRGPAGPCARTRTSRRSGRTSPTTRSGGSSTRPASTSPRERCEEPLDWQNSQLLEGDAIDAVARLHDGDGPGIIVLGSGQVVRQAAGTGT